MIMITPPVKVIVRWSNCTKYEALPVSKNGVPKFRKGFCDLSHALWVYFFTQMKELYNINLYTKFELYIIHAKDIAQMPDFVTFYIIIINHMFNKGTRLTDFTFLERI